jgi:hypothetical protein
MLECAGCGLLFEKDQLHPLAVTCHYGETKVEQRWEKDYCYDCFLDFMAALETVHPPCCSCRRSSMVPLGE